MEPHNQVTPNASTAPKVSRAEHRLREAIMRSRGAPYPEQADPRLMLNPGSLKDGLKAAERLAQAIMHEQTIIGVADFDCDGCCGSAIFVRGMKMLAQAVGKNPRVEIVIPDRFHYGYGLSIPLADDQLAPMLPDVVVTIDNGISSQEAIAHMNAWSSAPATIITDHHQPGETLPPAYAIVNPNQPDCLFQSKALCGAGVVFKVLLLVRRVLARLAPAHVKESLRNAQFSRLSELVAIATIGDVVPLEANNRLLVRQGLARINKGWGMKPLDAHTQGYLSFGVRRLLELAGVESPITAMDIAFKLVPQINGVGRLEKPRAGLACLLADNRIMADLEAQHCFAANQQRKEIQTGMQDEADRLMEGLTQFQAQEGSSVGGMPSVVLDNDEWHPGIVGLVASRIKDRTEGAVICLAPEGDPSEGGPVSDTLKGSGRSSNVHLRDTLALVATWAPDLELRFGGHARAAGLTINRVHLPRFRELFARAVAHQVQVSPLSNPNWHDGPLDPQLRTVSLACWIEQQPWGQMFPEPVFEGRFVVEQVREMRGRHVRLRVRDQDGASDSSFELVWFFCMSPETGKPVNAGDVISLDYTLGVNRWNNSERLQGLVKGLSGERTAAKALAKTQVSAPAPTPTPTPTPVVAPSKPASDIPLPTNHAHTNSAA